MVENLRNDEKTAATGKKSVKKKPPERGYAHWSQDTFDKLVGGEPEPLRSHFQVNHQMVMSLLDRPVMTTERRGTVDGCGAVRRLMVDNHETRKRQRGHIQRAIAIYRSLVEADLLEFPDPPDELRPPRAGELRPAGRVRAPPAAVAVGARGDRSTAGATRGSRGAVRRSTC